MIRRVLVVAATIAAVLVPQSADAGFGLAKWREQWAVKHPAPTLSLQNQDLNLLTTFAVRKFHREYNRWLHRAWVAWSKYAEEQRRIREAAAAQQPQHVTNSFPVVGSCHGMIAQAFGSRGLSVSYAIAIAERESGCYAGAQNPIHLPLGNASGVFQILYPGIWEMWDGRCGHEYDSVFNAWANIDTAACMVASGGWGPWGG